MMLPPWPIAAALALLAARFAAEGLPTLSVGIGLHRGVGVAASVESRDLMRSASALQPDSASGVASR